MKRKRVKSKGVIGPPLLIICIFIFGSYLLSTTLVKKTPIDLSEQYAVDQTSIFQKKETVQLGNLKLSLLTPTLIPTIVPTSSPDVCNHDMFKKADPLKCACDNAWLVRCEGELCKEIKKGTGTTQDMSCAETDSSSWCKVFAKEGDGWYCIGKPVIYLYPKEPILVDVAVKTEGEIFVSDPKIEEGNKWTDVLANPDGTLFYQGKTYRELFYESKTRNVKRPKKGIIISKQNLRKELLSFITQLGLTEQNEQKEFLDWWIPQLEKIETNNLFVSILEKDEKLRLDKVYITPKPDTFIEFIAYFAPLYENETVDPLVLPPTPKRIGFTAIEWGGVIGSNF